MDTVETLDSAAPRPSAGLFARLRESTAAREGVYVFAAQGLATLILLCVDFILYKELSKPERGALTTALGLRNVFLYVADMGLSLTTVRVASVCFARNQ